MDRGLDREWKGWKRRRGGGGERGKKWIERKKECDVKKKHKDEEREEICDHERKIK